MLSFIKNKTLRKTIEDSIEYMNILFDESQDKNKSELFKDETYRVLILYVVAVIEAILLYIFQERKEEITTLKYKNPCELPNKIKHIDFQKEKLVVAIQVKEIKNKEHIGMKDLVDFMRKNKLITKGVSEEILAINNVRNTFHFTKPRDNIRLEVVDAENAFALLLKIIKGAPKTIVPKK